MFSKRLIKIGLSDFMDRKGLLLFFAFFLASFFLIFYPTGELYDYKILSLYAIASGISLFAMFSKYDNHNYSVNKTFYIFHYFFFGLVPAVQFKKNITFFGAQELTPDLYYELGLCLIMVQLVYFIIYNTVITQTVFIKFVKKLNRSNTNYSFGCYIILGVFSSLFFLYLISENFEVMFIKPRHHWQKNNTKFGLIGYTLFLIIRAVPLVSFLLYKLNNRSAFLIKDLILLFFVVFVAFPTSLPRATMASYYLPIVLIYSPFFLRKYNYVLCFLVMFFLIFPIFNFFRDFKFSDITLGIQFFETAHMDAFHNFAQLYSQQIITDGKQLLGSVLFFVQESHWPNRPVGTGKMLAEVNSYSYTNISMPFWGEGYANFGFLGILFFCVFLAFLNSFLDLFHKLNNNFVGIICFLFFIGFEFYLLRGDLYSSCKKLFSFTAAIILVKLSLELIGVILKKRNLDISTDL